jgi:hypothetical protein
MDLHPWYFLWTMSCMAGILWLKTRSVKLPPTRVRANAVIGLGCMCILFAVWSLSLPDRSVAASALMAVLGLVVFRISRYIRARAVR